MREIKKFKRVLAANRGAGNPSGRRKRLPGGGDRAGGRRLRPGSVLPGDDCQAGKQVRMSAQTG